MVFEGMPQPRQGQPSAKVASSGPPEDRERLECLKDHPPQPSLSQGSRHPNFPRVAGRARTASATIALRRFAEIALQSGAQVLLARAASCV